MADAKQVATGNQKARTEISYCSHLDVYRYRSVDGQVYLFDTGQLEEMISAYLRSGDARQADFMAVLTSFGRQFPHKVVSFDENGNTNVTALVARKLGCDDEGAAGGEKSVG